MQHQIQVKLNRILYANLLSKIILVNWKFVYLENKTKQAVSYKRPDHQNAGMIFVY